MQHRNKADHHSIQRNISEQVDNLLFEMDSENSAENTVWVPDNYDDIQLSSHELDDIMNEASDPDPNFHRQPTHSPLSAPSIRNFQLRSAPTQVSHTNMHAKEELQQIAPTSRPQPHCTHPQQHLTPHTPQPQNPPPQQPVSHMSSAQSHHQRIMLPQHQFQYSTPPHGIIQHDLPVSQHISSVDLSQAFSLPQTIAGSFPAKQEPSLTPSIPHYFVSPEHEVVPNVASYHSPQQVLPLQNDPRVIDRDKYVRRSAFKADQAKLVHRTQLKQEQRQKEAEAEARGSPLTAKDKERERSRRESAVTRKRAEVYISELERVSRRLPEVEQKLRLAEVELHRLRRTVADFEQQRRQSQQMNTMLVGSRQVEVKSEPSLSLSPSSERTTTVLNRMQQLDLRLPNTSQAE